MGTRASARWRRLVSTVVVLMGLVGLAACNSAVGEPSLLLVSSDRTVPVALRCAHATATCTGTALVRVGGLDTGTVAFAVGAGATGSITVTLTEDQYALVPATGYAAADVVVDDATPSNSAVRSAGSVGLRRRGSSFTEKVSIATDGSNGGGEAYHQAMSADGRLVVFDTQGTLAPGDTNRRDDVYLRDRLTKVTTRISLPRGGRPDAGQASFPAISGDGRFVAFNTSAAAPLLDGDTNAVGDVYVHDRLTGAHSVVSVASDGTQGNGTSHYPSISADGRYVAFSSSATNLVPGDTNGEVDLFVRDRETGTTVRASVASDGTQADDRLTSVPLDLAISDDGRHVAFQSDATNLVPGDTNGVADIFHHDLTTGTTTRVSVSSAGTQAATGSDRVAISGDGSRIAFTGPGSLAGAGTGIRALLHDRTTGATTVVSTALDGTAAAAWPSDISRDGRYVVFRSEASNLVGGDTGISSDVFVRDLATATTARVSVRSDGSQANHHSGGGDVISADGRSVAFYSIASDLDPTNPLGGTHIFVRDLG